MKIADMSVSMLDSMGTDLSVVNAARVSFHKESVEFGGKDASLINYLARHNHWTPFGHCFATFRIKAPIFVARQLAKHQVGLVWNEVSRRYVDEEPEFWFPREWRGKPENAKQGSSGVVDDNQPYYRLSTHVPYVLKYNSQLYMELIQAGVAPEQARMVLPQNTLTEWIWSGTMFAFARVCRLRLDPHTQQETTEVARMISAACERCWPVSWAALMKDNS